jgi:OmcA/MtrC family decaheme c-type cytochrome
MKRTIAWVGVASLVLATLAGCGGGGGGGDNPPPPSPPSQLGPIISAAAAVAANDSATNASSAFKVLQDNGVPAVTVTTAAQTVNFTVFSDGAVRQGLTLSNISVAIAKLVPGVDGEIDRWESYVSRTETATPGVGPGGNPALASARQATTDPKPSALANQLVYNADGYYTYKFSTNLTDPSKTFGVVFEPARTHRIAIQLSYVNARGQTVRVNPYFDVTFDAAGKSVPVIDPARTRVMADVSSCNGCHDKLALHGGGRVDVQYCVMCHNPGTVDANSGNVLTMQTMVHKIHAGKLLAAGGEDYTIWGYQNSKHSYAEVGFPQDLRNCAVCHSSVNPATPQGDNWKTRAAKDSCLTCHSSKPTSAFYTTHLPFAQALLGPSGKPTDIANKDCAGCHRAGVRLSPDTVHWNQNEENAARYRMNIESVSYSVDTRLVTVSYNLSDPVNGNARYNLVTSDCTGSGATVSCGSTTRFGNLRFYVAYGNLVGQPAHTTEFSSYNNGGSSANAFAYKGVNNGSNRYTITIPIPADTATALAKGTARVVSIGQVKEARLEAKALEPRPEVSPRTLVNVVVQNTYADVALSGVLSPRRQVVSNDKCNVCHGALGTSSGSNTLAEAFHSGARNTVEACNVCHDALRSSSTVMTNGLQLREAYDFKRMIHGIHGNSKRTTPFTHGNNVYGLFSKAGVLLGSGINASTGAVVPAGTPFAAGVENYAAEVAWPGVGINCNACHVNNSYQRDQAVLGSVVSARTGDPLTYKVLTPRASACTACHDASNAIAHVTTFGGSSFGGLTMGQFFATPRETCDDCHSAGAAKGVDVVHGQR